MRQKFKNVCIVDTPYALLQYLLKIDIAGIESTLFCVGKQLHPDITRQLPHVKYFGVDDNKWTHFTFRLFFKMKCMWARFLYVRGARIYAQDHLHFSAQLIAHDGYTLMEDGPYVWKNNKDRLNQKASLYEKIGVFIVYGPVFLKNFGRSSQCQNRWVSTTVDADIYRQEGVCHERFNVRALWADASDDRKDMIIRVFGAQMFKASTRDLFRNCESMLLTQPLEATFGLTADEVFTIYNAAIEKYLDAGVIIKPHPRDTYDYEKKFPSCKVLRTTVPLQLMCAMGFSPKRAITLFSGSINELPESTDVVWLGTEVNGKLVAACGHIEPPERCALNLM